MSNTKRRVAVMLVVAIAVVGMTVPAAMAAAPTVDTETTDTTTTTEINDGATITYNASQNSTLSFSTDSPNGSVEILQNGTELQTYTNDSDAVEHVSTATGTYYYNFTIADDETGYQGVEADAGETVELTYRMVNDSAMDDPDTTNVTINWANHANKSFTRYDTGDVEVADDLGFFQSFSIPFFGANTSTAPAQSNASVGVNGDSQETITTYVADEDAQDALDYTHDAASDSGLSWMGTVSVEETLVPVLTAGSDGPEWLETDDRTYATIADGGETLTVHNAGDTLGSDAGNATVEAIGADAAGLQTAFSMTRDYGASYTSALSNGVSALDINGDPFDGS